ncbi:terminus macrodomain insulation protein YfbV [Bowmanella sp. JS7-9]|uniref:UPF0208 membrane protein YfbV n=1 Tax=Pseudobowmanella zhangzhouensis TaxID=1537679 RepID=A0ABW1XMX6_9ALTE|nr:terminus macrodomain insulation protein YfbV [Bowmanella sp. JS7-9]TBX27472.1 membrane protein [Bowmanella sp. JS7-9]
MTHPQSSILREGQDYMDIWPVRRELYAMFPECRIISATRFSIKIAPPIAVSLLVAQYLFAGIDALVPMLAVAAFVLSLPVQGLIWLGVRARQPLPPATRNWFYQIKQKMRGAGEFSANNGQPRYRELAQLLDRAFNHMDKAFTEHWF